VTARLPAASASELHRQWLELVDTDGPFLAIPPLKRVWPQGMAPLSDERKETLGYARKDFENAWENFDRSAHDDASQDSYRVARNKWVETVLRDVVGWSESLSWGQVAGVQAQSPNRLVTVTAHASLTGPDGIGALVYLVDPVDSLRETPNDLWAATPIDRMESLLRGNNIQIGIVTDGRWWGLVCARPGSMTASGIVDALTWIEEPRTRDAFLTVIGRQYIIGGDAAERLPVLFEESVAAAEEITEALGAQVRRAVELLIQSFSESAAEARRRGVPDPLPDDSHQVYEAAVTVMMRVVFLLFAEERGLLPAGELFEQSYGIARELDRLQARETQESEEALDATFLTWHRLLATSQALYQGASFESMRMPAYGGSLFDPDRFLFLTRTTEHGTLALTVSDRVMAHVLRSVQLAVLRGGEARRISFRDIDVEQIGYIYEGLLGYTAITVDEVNLGLRGTAGEEPEIPLSVLEALATRHHDPKSLAAGILSWVEHDQPAAKPQSVAAIAKAIGAEPEPNAVSALTQIVGHDSELRDRIEPRLAIVRLDLRGRPLIVLDGGLMVKETPSRRNSGAHYTPRSLAEEVVLHALQPLCYSPGPHQTADELQWKLKSSDDILSLKVADIACGSGAFLVSAARYLADRIVEAWMAEDSANAQRRDLHLRAIREVVANCLYGADINDMAVEMCKLSLWLVSLDRDLPFSFVDDKIFLGNSLLGLTSLSQLRKLHINPSRVPAGDMFDIFDIDIDAIIDKAVDLRRKLATEIDELDPARNSAAKRRQLAELDRVTDDLRRIADGVVAAGLPLGGRPGRELDEAYQNLRIAVKAAHPVRTEPNPSHLESIIYHGLTPTVPTDFLVWRPLHWVLEAPDIMLGLHGFDAVIGNPPFLVSKKISGAIGVPFREWIIEEVAGGTKGAADLVAYFLLRAISLLRPSGSIGLITSKVIAEGDTREVALDPIVGERLVITYAKSSEPWPSSTVAVRYAMVCGTLNRLAAEQPAILDGKSVTAITSQLAPSGRVSGKPSRLASNIGQMQKGAFLLGSAFVLDRPERDSMVAANRANAQVIDPYLGGEDINSSAESAPSRFVINFENWPEVKAAAFKEPYRRIQQAVYPIRAKDKIASRRELWWQFAVRAAAIHELVEHAGAAICVTVVSKYGMPVRIQAGPVISSAVAICADASFGRLIEMSSVAHNAWAWEWGSTMKSDLRYNPSDVFDTFPFIGPDNDLEKLGREFDQARRGIMIRKGCGLTKLYNLVHDPSTQSSSDPDVTKMRSLHQNLDNVVLGKYGWGDIELKYDFHSYRNGIRWTVENSVRVEILERLLEENHRRAGAAGGGRAPATPRAKVKKGRAPSTEVLF
jgi:methylase of polypeptide subunit release factors